MARRFFVERLEGEWIVAFGTRADADIISTHGKKAEAVRECRIASREHAETEREARYWTITELAMS